MVIVWQILWAKSSYFNWNSHNCEFRVRIKDFALGSSWSCDFTVLNRKLLKWVLSEMCFIYCNTIYNRQFALYAPFMWQRVFKFFAGLDSQVSSGWNKDESTGRYEKKEGKVIKAAGSKTSGWEKLSPQHLSLRKSGKRTKIAQENRAREKVIGWDKILYRTAQKKNWMDSNKRFKTWKPHELLNLPKILTRLTQIEML